jgi:pimeloyl-ACP methyl ester carboxylesterase
LRTVSPVASWNLAVTASATAAVACIGTWATDFRDDLPKIDVPVLVIHGDAQAGVAFTFTFSEPANGALHCYPERLGVTRIPSL